MCTEAVGGVRIETWPDAGLPRPWFEDVPGCWDELYSTQWRDAGWNP